MINVEDSISEVRQLSEAARQGKPLQRRLHVGPVYPRPSAPIKLPDLEDGEENRMLLAWAHGRAAVPPELRVAPADAGKPARRRLQTDKQLATLARKIGALTSPIIQDRFGYDQSTACNVLNRAVRNGHLVRKGAGGRGTPFTYTAKKGEA
jgi:hypothetical protein